MSIVAHCQHTVNVNIMFKHETSLTQITTLHIFEINIAIILDFYAAKPVN